MTPKERDLVDGLFDRLASLENSPRDPEASRAIADGLQRAPNAPYALVQTVLVQDEALRHAQEHIRELEAELGVEPEPQRQPVGFLDNVRDTLFGTERRRGSVPSVRPGASGLGAQPGMGPQQDYGRGGGSFLGTAAATAAGVIGGSLLMQSMGSLFGQDRANAAYDSGSAGRDSPWGNASDSNLAREAGLDDIGRGSDAGSNGRAGLFDSDQDSSSDFADLDEGDFDGGFDGGDSEA